MGEQKIRIMDTTLRDGSHAVRHQFTKENVRQIVQALDEAGVPVIEVTHGDGLGGSTIQYGVSLVDEMELIEEAVKTSKRAKIAALLLPGVGTKKELMQAKDIGIEMVRIATQCSEADVSQQHFGLAKELGLETVGFLMMAHMLPPEELAEQARLMESYGADTVYIVDSAGTMMPDDVSDRVDALRKVLQIPIGFHGHNNMGLAIGNSIAAIKAGALNIDTSTRGLGAGSGNTQTEVLVGVLSRLGYETGIDLFKIMDAAEYIVNPVMHDQMIINRDALTIGCMGVYSTFLIHAKNAGEKFGVDPRNILMELGRRKAVAGQEDWILDVAAELSEMKG
ncbi:4-hydroxy-2-oxovalerate aldolase [Paenibacillus validus]|uniref:4-hydroxy-2-oxovalerate aldolase n=1 Tax=Paenibacillus validus TaxID=44253 RepID=A0A7X2Z8Y8_9BACL|nr:MULTISPECIES: 4-hydroxy-2-oxovalerate aldolase [Paenibacillus]MED4600636.1 4-hydroxy-2-oxovalerate aldolase [Paenibacillus validus]MED4606269.1 4-hydroxy-2-oxovalerate aldolase [Paenibacillus validus]MUG69905.1 4-hydroxy-2-oxovalerate aldolase [Paenibacillus validus]